jgi:PAT family beta-lactamase induction signal transducer AmpG
MKGAKPRNLLDTRSGRFLAFGAMYVSEGIPYGFSSTAMVAFMRREGLALEQIGLFVGALFIPWAFKWAWAPLIDIVTMNRFGGRKAWIIGCTTMMIVTLLLTAAVDFVSHFELLLMAVVLNNFFCATQDVAIDALAVSSLQEEERGRGNGFMFAGQYLGIALGGGGAIFVYGLWGFDVALVYISALLLASLAFVVVFIRDPAANGPEPERPPSVLLAFVSTLKTFVGELMASFFRSGKGPVIGLLFSVLPIGAMALGYATVATMKVDHGLTDGQIAELSVYHTLAAGLGCLVGGVLGDRFGLKRMIGVFYVLTTLPTLYLAVQISLLGLPAIPRTEFYAAVIVYGLFFGMAFGLRPAIFMGMTNPAIAATQFTAFMAMGNLAISYTNYWQGIVAGRFGYAAVLYLDALIVIVPLVIMPFLRNREPERVVGQPVPAPALS